MRKFLCFIILVAGCTFIYSCNCKCSCEQTQPRCTSACCWDLLIYLSPGGSSIYGTGTSWLDPFGGQAGFGMRSPASSSPFSFQPEFAVTKAGSKYQEPTVSGEVQFLYLNLPLLAKYQKNRKGFYGEAGLQPGINIVAKDKYNGRTDDYKVYTQPFELAVPVGVGYSFNGFSIGVRIVPGITNINRGPGNTSDNDHNLLKMVRLSYTLGTIQKLFSSRK